jgi:hypothetical protein
MLLYVVTEKHMILLQWWFAHCGGVEETRVLEREREREREKIVADCGAVGFSVATTSMTFR